MPFLNDTAGGGGFLIGQDGSMSLLVNTTIMGANAVNGYGGAILLIGAATFNMINSSIQGATVGSDVLYSSGGGAIFAEFDSKVTPNKIPYLNVTNSTFINNVASTGGGIDCQNCRLDLNNVQFIGNNATSSAGALMLENWNWTTTATTLLGKIGFYNNRVLDPIYGVGGAIFMDTQAALIINTTDLTMDGNVAKGGSAIWNQDWYWSDSAVGALNYNPPANSPPSAQPNITVGQTIYFEKAKFANYIANNGGGYPAALSNGFDSPVVAVIPVNGTSQFNGLKTLNSNLYLPDLSFYLVNAFGTQSIYVVPWAYPVMRVTFTTSSGKILRTVYKGPASITDAIITLRDINLVGLQYPVDFNGTIIASFSILQQSDQSSSSRVVTTSFNIPACTTPNLLVAGTNPDGSPQYSENGKLQYVCVPGYKVSTAARDTIFSLSILMLALACGLAVFSHVHRRSKIYKVSSPFFTLVISMGCIFQLLSVSVQGFFSSASAFNCMAGVWLELIGFVLGKNEKEREGG